MEWKADVSTKQHKDEGKVTLDGSGAIEEALSATHVHNKAHRQTLFTGKTYLFMEAKELAVAYSAVQNAVNVDVVGLWEEKENGAHL